MNKPNFRSALTCACVIAPMFAAATACAQEVGKPLRIIQGFAAGGGHDTVARLLAPVTGSQLGVQVIVEAHPGLPVKTLNDVAALARKNPNKLSAGSPGIGGLSHLTLEIFKRIAKADIEHVAYKGTAAALTDVLGGYVPIIIGDLPGPLPHVKSGRLHALAVTSEKRTPLLPDVPTASEQGFRELQSTNWYGVMAPAGIPAASLTRLHAALVAGAQTAETRERFSTLGFDPVVSASPAAFTTFVREEFTRWEAVVRSSGVKLQQ